MIPQRLKRMELHLVLAPMATDPQNPRNYCQLQALIPPKETTEDRSQGRLQAGIVGLPQKVPGLQQNLLPVPSHWAYKDKMEICL